MFFRISALNRVLSLQGGAHHFRLPSGMAPHRLKTCRAPHGSNETITPAKAKRTPERLGASHIFLAQISLS
jgi:hypothetical protein